MPKRQRDVVPPVPVPPMPVPPVFVPDAEDLMPIPHDVPVSPELFSVVEWCSHCAAPRLVDTKKAHWCGQCRRVPLQRIL